KHDPLLEPARRSRFYIFDPDKLHAIARRAVGLPHDQMVEFVIDELAREYPGHIETKQEWIFSCAGGAVGVMTILHGSLSEYLAIFGTAIGTGGFSGRYRIGVYDCVLAGEMWTFTGDRVGTRVIHKAGDQSYLRPDQVKGWRFPEACWLLEYGHGPIPTSLPFALADSVFSMMDGETIWKSLWLYGRLVVKELLQGKI
ncbi:MAG: ERG2 family protein, partial [Isosphaeraceae bacterium]